MTGVRYTDPAGKKTFLTAETPELASRLYGYAVRVATAEFFIELMIGGRMKKSHQV